jgi:mannose-6-phosphate isomerase
VEDTPYAELWLGTHPSLPSFVGETPLTALVGSLPYLLKVLSVSLPLSIQVHPDTAQAQRLHSQQPEIYINPLHKVELFYALSEFKLLLGFKTDQEITVLLDEVPELLAVVGKYSDLKQALEALYRDEGTTQHYIGEFLARMRSQDPSHYSLGLDTHFPEDTGIFFSLFMNYCTFQPGQAILITPGTPHSYLSGFCIECMSASDNVVRAGLTPKRKDVGTLLELLDYSARGRPQPLLPQVEGGVSVFRTRYQEFELRVLKSSAELEVAGPAILLAVSGSATLCQSEQSLPLVAGESAVLTASAYLRVECEGEFFLCQENLALKHRLHYSPCLLALFAC